MKKLIYSFTFKGSWLLLIITIILYSCASTSSFIRQTKEIKGDAFLSTDQGNQVMIDACKYGIKKAGLTLDKEVKLDDNIFCLYATLGSAMQSWGEHVKITIMAGEKTQDKQISKSYYTSARRIAMNVTEDLYSIQKNIETFAKNYLEAAQEGIDINNLPQKK